MCYSTDNEYSLSFTIRHDASTANGKPRFVIFSLLYGSVTSILIRVTINRYHKVRPLLAQDRKKHRNKDVGRSILNLRVYKNVASHVARHKTFYAEIVFYERIVSLNACNFVTFVSSDRYIKMSSTNYVPRLNISGKYEIFSK